MMKDVIEMNGCITPKDWTVNVNSRKDYTVYQEWLEAQV